MSISYSYKCDRCGCRLWDRQQAMNEKCRRCGGKYFPLKSSCSIAILAAEFTHREIRADQGFIRQEVSSCRVTAEIGFGTGRMTSKFEFDANEIILVEGVPDLAATVRDFIVGLMHLIGSDETRDESWSTKE
ncbi:MULTISPECIES: hypothetical protein [unclassified Paenibacillus]|uniref:hypothetical protein n=1 Tax=unclassified Paenibacillus TaxID=185978 RepID=UPI0009A8CC4E|nr:MULTISPECIES: hypothetical protein [unclassified Paenibacillus]SLJ98221.1 hypothetical protein SAMN06272722_102715 [Paenibacillus sp. RU5A]SOC66800.1 hypothetical protein SAMN05880581_102282 [Paenibacillus sp. RU26A]SOC70051.1 hypothetical protein SAMN05880586_102715 [Paenibacillus sp. RU5M]